MKRGLRTAAQTAFWMAILTLISKLLGFIREMVMAAFFGTSYVVDAYVMAVAIPSMIFLGIFAAIATAYMPLLSQKIEKEGERSAYLFTSHMINIVFMLSVVSSLLGLLFSDQIVAVFARGFEGETAALTAFFIKVTFSYGLFSSAAGILESFLQYRNTFLPQIVVGYIQNLIVIITIVLSALYNYYFLPFGLLIAYAIRLLLIWILAKSRGLRYRLSINNRGTIKTILPLAIPVFIGTSISQISIFVDKTLASGLTEGSVSALNYGSLLNGMVMAMFISILTTIIYPKLAQANALDNHQRFSEIVEKGITVIFIIAFPFALGAMLYSQQIVQIVYERGAFDPAATALTQSAYFYYSVGLLFMALNDLLIRVYYSLQDMKTPMIFGGISVIIDIILNFVLVQFMAHNGLALATSIGAACNTILLIIGLKKKYPNIKLLESQTKILKIILAAVISVSCSYMVYAFIMSFLAQIVFIRMVQLGIAVGIAILIYFILLRLLRIPELELLKSLFVRK